MPTRKRGLEGAGSTSGPQPRKRKADNSGSSNARVLIEWYCEANSKQHHTDEYANDVLVLRRGEGFKLGLTFEGVSFSEIKNVVLLFSIEPKPKGFEDTISTRCGCKDNIDKSKWEMKIVERHPGQLKVVMEVNIPVTAFIGRYSIDVLVSSLSSEPLKQLDSVSSKPLKTSSQIIVIFNPWNKEDDVYLKDEKLRHEYVLNDVGLIYRGSPYHRPKFWNFGQFEEDILDCVLFVLEKDKRAQKYPLKELRKRDSPVWIARVLSAVLNCQDDDGVLVGNWSGNYEDGSSPSSWNGSVEIFQSYYEREQPVKYGQCWVFSGIMTTALRALGIPARSVTNFDSAHDTDQTMTIDKFFDENGKRIDDLCDDSIWNFHVWNEIWTKRKDLPDNSYDGWQAVDSTPQEESSGISQMGPAPLKAVKEGEIFAGFDTGFVFGEVNADIVKWMIKRDERGKKILQKMSRNSHHVGKNISTKSPYSYSREDITHLYKYREGTHEERKAFNTAHSFGQGPKIWSGQLDIEEEGNDLTIDTSTSTKGPIPNGSDFSCIIKVKNVSKQKLTVDISGVISSAQYCEYVKELVKEQKFGKVEINAGRDVSREIRVLADDYLSKLTDSNSFKFVVVANVLETKKYYVDESSLLLFNEDCIEIEVPPLKVGKRCRIKVTFTNTLPITLSNLRICVEGAGLGRPLRRRYRRKLRSGKQKSVPFYILPRHAGERMLLVDVDTAQIKDFKASKTVQVSRA